MKSALVRGEPRRGVGDDPLLSLLDSPTESPPIAYPSNRCSRSRRGTVSQASIFPAVPPCAMRKGVGFPSCALVGALRPAQGERIVDSAVSDSLAG